MFKYAQLNENNTVVGISNLSGPVNLPHMIALSENDNAVTFGWRYIGGEWLEPLEDVNV